MGQQIFQLDSSLSMVIFSSDPSGILNCAGITTAMEFPYLNVLRVVVIFSPTSMMIIIVLEYLLFFIYKGINII